MKKFDGFPAEQPDGSAHRSALEELGPAYQKLQDRLEGMKTLQKPRDPERIPAFLSRLEAVWRKSPDMRFGQLVSVVFSHIEQEKKEPFYVEDDDMLSYIEGRDAGLLATAASRMEKADPASFIPAEQLYKEMGITQEALDAAGEADIE